MGTYIIHRPLHMILVLTGVTLLTFLLFHAMPGDPARMMLGMRPNVTTIAMPRQQWGYDKPLIVPYWMFLKRAAAGDLRRSANEKRVVLETILERAPDTALLAALLAGSFIVEFIFVWTGTGLVTIQAIQTRVLPMIQGTVLFAAFIFVIVNLLADIGYRILDPRVKR